MTQSNIKKDFLAFWWRRSFTTWHQCINISKYVWICKRDMKIDRCWTPWKNIQKIFFLIPLHTKFFSSSHSMYPIIKFLFMFHSYANIILKHERFSWAHDDESKKFYMDALRRYVGNVLKMFLIFIRKCFKKI
jgi:hypothetical protein